MFLWLVIPFAVGLIIAIIVWFASQLIKNVPTAAAVRAASVALGVMPVIAPAPELHGSLPLPYWWLLVYGWAKLGADGMASLAIYPIGAFVVLFPLIWMAMRSRSTARIA